ncbi:unnamed protein product, partial [Brassica rapa subsp. narinosa]
GPRPTSLRPERRRLEKAHQGSRLQKHVEASAPSDRHASQTAST